jgi:hypothetical protein
MSALPMPTIEKIRIEASEPNEPAQAERLPLMWADRAFEATAPLEFLVDGLLTVGSVNLLVAPGGSGKTWVAYWLAVCVAMGKAFLGFATRQGGVLIVDEESGPRRGLRRLLEVFNGAFVKREDAPPIAFISLAQLDLGNPDDVSALHVRILEANARLVIIDALADVMPGCDENSVKDVMPVMMNLRSLAETTQATFVVLHHSNKATGGYRGSTAIQGAVDLLLQMEKAPESKYISFSVEKARDIEPRKFTAMATWLQDPPQFYLSETDVNPKAHLNKSQCFVLRYLADNPNAEMAEITGAADVCTPSTARTAVYNLVGSGHVQKTGTGKTGRGNKQQFDLTDKGRDAIKGDE